MVLPYDKNRAARTQAESHSFTGFRYWKSEVSIKRKLKIEGGERNFRKGDNIGGVPKFSYKL